MNQQCGLANPNNPFWCSKIAKTMEAAGKMQKDNKWLTKNAVQLWLLISEGVANEVPDLIDKNILLFHQNALIFGLILLPIFFF